MSLKIAKCSSPDGPSGIIKAIATFVGFPSNEFHSIEFLNLTTNTAAFLISKILAWGIAKPSSNPVDPSFSRFSNPFIKAFLLETIFSFTASSAIKLKAFFVILYLFQDKYILS
jgi:hypothetical protein